MDYREMAERYQIALTKEDLKKFDKVEVVNKSAFYPGVWSKTTQSEDLQVQVLQEILLQHLKTRPIKALNKKRVMNIIKQVEARIYASKLLNDLLQKIDGTVHSSLIRDTDAVMVRSNTEALLKMVQEGKMDEELDLNHQHGGAPIKRLYHTLKVVQQQAMNRQEAEMQLAWKRKEVSWHT